MRCASNTYPNKRHWQYFSPAGTPLPRVYHVSQLYKLQGI